MQVDASTRTQDARRVATGAVDTERPQRRRNMPAEWMPNARRVDAKRPQMQCQVISWQYCMYKINCTDCSWSNTGKTGRALKTGRNEHERNLKNCKKTNLTLPTMAEQTITGLILLTRKCIDTASY